MRTTLLASAALLMFVPAVASAQPAKLSMAQLSGVAGGMTGLKSEIEKAFKGVFMQKTQIDFDKDLDVDADVDSKADVSGNLATVVFDVEALGDDTFTELDLNVLTTDKSSSIVGSAISAASSGDGMVKKIR